MAARSESAPASARWPTSSGPHRGPRRKCVPSTMASTDVTARAPARTTAASSPSQRTTREAGRRARAAPIASISASSPMPVDDPRAVEVIRRDLDPHPIPRQDPDAEPPHLARDVPEDDVAVVELHPEHRVRERLDDLAFELDLLFLGQLDDPDVGRLGALAGLTQLVLDLRTFGERAEAIARNAREVHERVLPSVIGSDEPEALLVAEPLHDTSCHTTPPHSVSLCARWCCRALPSRMLNRPSGGPTRGLYQARRRSPSARRGLPAGARIALAGGRPLGRRLVEVGVEALLGLALRLGRGGRRAGRRGRRDRDGRGRVGVGAGAGAGAAPELRLRLAVRGGAGAGPPAAAARVAAEEGREVRRMQWRLEVAAEAALRLLHVVRPDLGRVGAAGHRPAVVLRPHLDLRLGIPDPDGRRHARGEADEPCVVELVRGARLARGGAADLRAGARALQHVLPEDPRRLGGDPVLEDPRALDPEAR